MSRIPHEGPGDQSPGPGEITEICLQFTCMESQGELGRAISRLLLSYSPRDLDQMKRNFMAKVRECDPEYQKQLEESITVHIQGTYQEVKILDQKGAFSTMNSPVPPASPGYWRMVAVQCGAGEERGLRIRFLKFLLAGFCMFVQDRPGHPVGMPFPGGDRVQVSGGVYYCPVRTKENDVDEALCPFCPALQTPGIGYLRPPVNASEHRKQEFIRNCYEFHNFNG